MNIREILKKAYKICADSLSFIEKRNLSRIKPDTLSRQIYLLTGEKDIIIGINKSSSTRDLFEIFQNKRRLFQFYIKIHDMYNAKGVLNELNAIINLLGNKLDKIYIGMYYRDLAKYFYIKNNLNFSKYYFKKALEIFSYNNFDGQKI